MKTPATSWRAQFVASSRYMLVIGRPRHQIALVNATPWRSRTGAAPVALIMVNYRPEQPEQPEQCLVTPLKFDAMKIALC